MPVLVHHPGPPQPRHVVEHGVVHVQDVLLAEPQVGRVAGVTQAVKFCSDVETVAWLVLNLLVSWEWSEMVSKVVLLITGR